MANSVNTCLRVVSNGKTHFEPNIFTFKAEERKKLTLSSGAESNVYQSGMVFKRTFHLKAYKYSCDVTPKTSG